MRPNFLFPTVPIGTGSDRGKGSYSRFGGYRENPTFRHLSAGGNFSAGRSREVNHRTGARTSAVGRRAREKMKRENYTVAFYYI
jgi:hypothetical protein